MIRIGLLLWLATCGCTPSDFVAHQFLRAPRTFPQVVNPQPRVYFSYPTKVTQTFPEQLATVGEPPITLSYRVIPSADYGAGLVLTNYRARGRDWPMYRFPARVPDQPLPSRGTVVLLHGYGLDHESMVPWALRLAGEGWTCVLVDLRGHGQSGGNRISFGLREAEDLSNFTDELARRLQVSWPVNAVGVSYGAAVALRWASIEPRVHRVVAITPYDRLAAAVEGLRRDYAAWLPERMILRATTKLPGLVGVPPGGLDPLEWLEERPVAALFVAAEADRVAPPEAVKRLAATASDSALLELPASVHEIAPFRLDLLAAPVAAWLAMPSSESTH